MPQITASCHFCFTVGGSIAKVDAICNIGGFSDSDLAVLTNTLIQNISDSPGPDVVELVVSPVANDAASAIQLTCLQLSIPDALSLSSVREIIEATFNEVFRAFFVPRPTLTSWCFADLSNMTIRG
jgi:hypothetical protein